MIEPDPQPQRLRLPPGSLFTGTRAYACDGALIEAVIEGSAEEPRITSCTIVELHDINFGRRRTRYDVGAFMRRCLKRIREEGLIIIVGDQVMPVAPERIQTRRVQFQQFSSRIPEQGPFDRRTV